MLKIDKHICTNGREYTLRHATRNVYCVSTVIIPRAYKEKRAFSLYALGIMTALYALGIMTVQTRTTKTFAKNNIVSFLRELIVIPSQNKCGLM